MAAQLVFDTKRHKYCSTYNLAEGLDKVGGIWYYQIIQDKICLYNFFIPSNDHDQIILWFSRKFYLFYSS